MIRAFLFAWLAGQTGASDALQHVQGGLEARKQHQVDVEIAEFRKATEIDPTLADAFMNLGAAYIEKHDYGSAIPPLKRALELPRSAGRAPAPRICSPGTRLCCG